jgi:hypothetical protein
MFFKEKLKTLILSSCNQNTVYINTALKRGYQQMIFKMENKSAIKNAIKKLASASLVMGAMIMGGCNGGGSNTYAPAWYNVYGSHCNSGDPSPGCNFYGDGSKITAGQDPYYSQNFFSYGTYYYYDSYGIASTYIGYAWQSPDGVLYDGNGYALNNDADRDSRDLVADVADAETKVVETVGKSFAEKYALSEATGMQVAKTLNDYATMSHKMKRARTEKDINDFGQRLFGVSPDKAKVAIDQARKGDPDTLLGMNDEVASFWGTSPETSKVILKTWYKNQLSELNVK